MTEDRGRQEPEPQRSDIGGQSLSNNSKKKGAYSKGSLLDSEWVLRFLDNG